MTEIERVQATLKKILELNERLEKINTKIQEHIDKLAEARATVECLTVNQQTENVEKSA